MRSDGKITWLRDVLGDSRVSDDINTVASLGDRFSVTAGTILARTGEYGREAFLIVFDSASFRSALHLSSPLAARVEGTREERTRVA